MPLIRDRGEPPARSLVGQFGGPLVDAVGRTVESLVLKEVKAGPVPRHLAIIMDGNRRFAEALGLSRNEGHSLGRDTLEKVLDWSLEVGIKHLTVYAFSTENFRRPPSEILHLMDLFEDNFLKMADDERVHRNKIHVRAIGQLDLLPARVQRAIQVAEDRTRAYDSYYYTVAVAYGGREEILRAIRSIARDVKEGRLRPEDVDEQLVSKQLYTSHLPQPDPDLILRTSGEERISNFLLWQLAYSELVFTDVYWPGFRKVDFLRVIRAFQQRQRRYGK